MNRFFWLLIVSVVSIANLASGQMQTYDVPGAVDTNVTGSNGANVVGQYNDGTGWKGFLYKDEVLTTLEMAGAQDTQPQDISGNHIVGFYNDTSNVKHGFYYDGANWTTLDAPSSSGTWAYGISGNVISGSYEGTNGVAHGFQYDKQSGVWTTFDQPGAENTHVLGISGSNMVGLSEISAGNSHSFLYDGATYEDIDIPGKSYTFPTDIDGKKVVGWTDNDRRKGFSRDENGVVTEFDVQGAASTEVLGIDGNTLVGFYTDASSTSFASGANAFFAASGAPAQHGFIWIIPEPSTLLLLLAGGLAIAIRSFARRICKR